MRSGAFPRTGRKFMKLALLTSNGEAVALASRLIAGGASACTAEADKPLPVGADLLLFDESTPLLSREGRAATRALLFEALSKGKPTLAFLSPNAPATPKCAIAMTELLGFSSAAAFTPHGASEILGLDPDGSTDDTLRTLYGDDPLLSEAGALARAATLAHELSFALVFDPDASRGVLYDGSAYTTVEAESIEGAIASLFTPAPRA